MASEVEKKNAFYAALLTEVKERFGGKRVQAAKALGINKNRIYEAESRQSGDYAEPQVRAVLMPCFQNGSEDLRRAAQTLLESKLASGQDRPATDFNFLYAGMQLRLVWMDQLLKASVNQRPSRELEELAAMELVTAFVAGHYYSALADCAVSTIVPVLPKELEHSHPNGYRDIACELLHLAEEDDVKAYQALQQLIHFEIREREHDMPLEDGARAVFERYVFHFAAQQVAVTFLNDGQRTRSLKRRALFKLATDIYKVLDQQDVALRVAVSRALKVMQDHNVEQARDCVSYINTITRCVTGNTNYVWIGETALVSVNGEGVSIERALTRGPKEVWRYNRPLSKLEHVTPNERGEMIVVVDDDKMNVYPVTEPMEWPYDKIALLVNHKLNETT